MSGQSSILPAALLGILLFSVPVAAQVRVIPQGGLYASVSDLGTVDAPDGIRTVGEQETSLAYGLTLEVGSDNAIAFRVTGLYGSRSEVPVGGIGCSGGACDLRRTVLGVSAGAVLRLFPKDFPLRPYVMAGGGLKKYDFEFEPNSGSSFRMSDAFGDDSRATLVLGTGFDWNLGILKGNVELADYISSSVLEDGDRQHDFFLTVGLILG